jgi:hypothetical protein
MRLRPAEGCGGRVVGDDIACKLDFVVAIVYGGQVGRANWNIEYIDMVELTMVLGDNRDLSPLSWLRLRHCTGVHFECAPSLLSVLENEN